MKNARTWRGADRHLNSGHSVDFDGMMTIEATDQEGLFRVVEYGELAGFLESTDEGWVTRWADGELTGCLPSSSPSTCAMRFNH
tara:strand:- start:17015 stop:17266 length:252 start_codon:yes stop_codon:yes gene_type:complete